MAAPFCQAAASANAALQNDAISDLQENEDAGMWRTIRAQAGIPFSTWKVEMMRKWTKILPFFFIEWYARRNCQTMRTPVNNDMVNPYPGVFICFPVTKKGKPRER